MSHMDAQIEKMLHGARYKQLLEILITPIREKYGLRKVDVEVLYYLSCCGRRNTPTDVKDSSLLTKSHISQSIDRMSRMNLLVMTPDGNDRRCIHLALTPQAHEIVAEIHQIREELQHIIFRDIPEDEIQAFCQVAAKIEKNINAALNHI